MDWIADKLNVAGADGGCPVVSALAQRAGLLPALPQLRDRLAAACAALRVGPDDVLEISRARRHGESAGEEVLVVLGATAICLVGIRRRGRWPRPARPVPTVVPLAGCGRPTRCEEPAGPGVRIELAGARAPLVLVWTGGAATGERTRMADAIARAQAGDRRRGAQVRTVAAEPGEIPIWEDPDIAAIATPAGELPRPEDCTPDALGDSDAALVARLLAADRALEQDGPPAGDAVARVCMLGVTTFEDLSPAAPAGWRKLVLCLVSDRTYELWDRHVLDDAAAKLAHWVIATVESNAWALGGRATPLGRHHANAMRVAVGTGAGIVLIDPRNGDMMAPTGDAARLAAATGRF